MDSTITQLRFPKPGTAEFLRLLDFCEKHRAVAQAAVPETIGELVDHFGFRPLFGLLFIYGGREILLPVAERHARSPIYKRLGAVMGDEAATWFIDRYGPNKFQIPSARRLLKAYRSHIFGRLTRLGLSRDDLSSLTGLDRRSIVRLTAAAHT